MSKPAFDLVLAGAEGQDMLLASRVLGCLALKAGCNVKISEERSTTPRGKSTTIHVRVGQQDPSPTVALGQADFLLGFEEWEAARAQSYLKPDGVAIVNTLCVWPRPVITGAAPYPEKPLAVFEGRRLETADALQTAAECGNPKAAGLVMLGRLSKHLTFDLESWLEAIARCVPRKTLPVYAAAFRRGREDA